ncbi:NACHT and WD domain protein [Aspergillus vadensis CBS 113365]|uniref:GPI inositol-deacylase n=1 Tax=Aspergillus vadensis (strain CBS 113365 / IMI 142717 / IBT 24658) TaxID=1448311 RepID=A0A319B2S1_ASPVC|nr:NACHT and WD domain protein [Aspergillus vadensis CBS 113365]PYH64510.1 NACHT and WD domain protein [Aspergillus vadensis CBS 113365]
MDDPKGPLGLNLLHSPLEPHVEFVFVHGLGGGSRKTWSKSTASYHYWPQAWLPKDPAFSNVRVHSFGYNSDYLKGKGNCLDIHHFAKSLLGELSTSPHLSHEDTPIVLLGHSMGGLVIKKAYLLASQDTLFEKLVKRFHAIYFFATPHRGSDSAKLLENILKITHSSRAYVSDLKRGSSTIQSINDEFRNHSGKMELWSFYETYKLTVGLFSILIVDPDSATLGYREEQQIPLGADHRSICKFDAVTDPNYITVRNALALTVSRISHSVVKLKTQQVRIQLQQLETYLGVHENVEDDLILLEDARMKGTCEWFGSKSSFLTWKSFENSSPIVFWVNGKPATGKSVLAGYVVSQLHKTRAGCSFYFFRHGDKSKSRLSGCLRSLALQMACTNAEVRNILLEMQSQGVRVDSEDERVLWRRLFQPGILRAIPEGHYWVIDALDECASLSLFFDAMLANLDESTRLRILVTSRATPGICRYFSSLGAHKVMSEQVSVSDTLPDIKLLVEARTGSLAVGGDRDRNNLVSKILDKSQGSFLWTALVLEELSNSHSEQEISQALQDMPRDMEQLYMRSLESMSQASQGKTLSKAVLIWTTCAARPLKITELEVALGLDVNDHFPRLEESVLSLCGQFVTIDKLGKVQMAHETAREFLLNANLKSEYAIRKEEAHTRIARTCLTYLTDDEMKPPRTSRRGATAFSSRKRSNFCAYACSEFSFHLSKSSPLATDVFHLLVKFLKANILSWIEMVAQTEDFNLIIRAAKYLRKYLKTCMAHLPPVSDDTPLITGWTTDLVRVATKFSDALLISPAAIYSLIIPFCPQESTIYNAGKTVKRLSVMGLSQNQWDDRMACIEFSQSQTTAICYGEMIFAVGLSSGKVALYDATSCQEFTTLEHGERVMHLQLSSRRGLIAACGMKTINTWEILSGRLISTYPAPSRPLEMIVYNDRLIVVSAKNYLASWGLDGGDIQYPHRPLNDSDNMEVQTHRVPSAVSISVGHQMMAVAYSRRPIILWDLQEDAYYGSCGKKHASGETSRHMVTALIFNPNPSIERLVVAYLDGELTLVDPFQDEVLVSFRANCQTLAASPDGRLLAGGVGSGIIQIYDFETLTLLYRVESTKSYIKELAFSPDSLRLADIRGTECNIWEPAILLGDSGGDGSSQVTSDTLVETVATETRVKITALTVDVQEDAVFCSKSDGSVCLYNMRSGNEIRTLYRHKISVHALGWLPKAKLLLSIDVSNRILGWRLKKSPTEGWLSDEVLFRSRLDCGHAITQALASDVAGKFILSTRGSDHLWSIGGHQLDMRKYSSRPGIRKWLQHHDSEEHVICFEGATARIYTWSDWTEVAIVEVQIDLDGLQIKNAFPCTSARKQRILLELSELDGPAKTCRLYLLDAKAFAVCNGDKPDSPKAKCAGQKDTLLENKLTHTDRTSNQCLINRVATLSKYIANCIGVTASSKVVFLDTHSWVCTADLDTPEDSKELYVRHFFVPYDWFSGSRHIISTLARRDVLMARKSDLAVIKGGLEYTLPVESPGAVIEG